MSVISLAGDPVYAAIRRYKATTTAFDSYYGSDDDPHRIRLGRAFQDAQNDFLKVIPGTLEGVRMKIEAFLKSPLGDDAEDCLQDFLRTISEAVRQIEVQS